MIGEPAGRAGGEVGAGPAGEGREGGRIRVLRVHEAGQARELVLVGLQPGALEDRLESRPEVLVDVEGGEHEPAVQRVVGGGAAPDIGEDRADPAHELLVVPELREFDQRRGEALVHEQAQPVAALLDRGRERGPEVADLDDGHGLTRA